MLSKSFDFENKFAFQLKLATKNITQVGNQENEHKRNEILQQKNVVKA